VIKHLTIQYQMALQRRIISECLQCARKTVLRSFPLRHFLRTSDQGAVSPFSFDLYWDTKCLEG
jgi:hypothetical protein